MSKDSHHLLVQYSRVGIDTSKGLHGFATRPHPHILSMHAGTPALWPFHLRCNTFGHHQTTVKSTADSLSGAFEVAIPTVYIIR